MSPATMVLQPEKRYEGAKQPLVPSVSGGAKGKSNELRDPSIFVENGRTYMIYAVAGESGLAMSELFFK